MLHKISGRFAVVALVMMALLVAACAEGPAAAPAAPTVAPAPTAPAAAEPTTAPLAEATATAAPAEEAAAPSADEVTFVIDPARSSVRFILTEMLSGVFTVVTGEGNGVAGAVTVNLDDYGSTTISPIEIDARSLATDNGFRDQAVGRFVLQHNQEENRFIRFTPTSIDGLPATATVGAPFEFSVTGDLTIRTITRPVTFTMTVTPLSENEIQGSGSTVVLRSDFDLQIPSVPRVADVSEEVTLEIDFVAAAE